MRHQHTSTVYSVNEDELARARLCSHADHLRPVSDLRLCRGEIDSEEDDHRLPLSRLQSGLACAARRRADSGLTGYPYV
jgi:hypothetical protein